MIDAVFALFDGVEPITGLAPAPASVVAERSALPVGWGGVHAVRPSEDAVFAAEWPLRVRRAGGDRYLQIFAWSPGAGAMEVFHGERRVDAAELAPGWINAAVDVESVPVDTELELVFRDPDGALLSDILVQRIFLSSEWGYGRRKRLKCHYPYELTATFENFAVYPCCARQWLKGNQCAGNTRETPLAEIWNAPVYQNMRESFLDGRYGDTCREEVCPVLNGERSSPAPSPAVIHAVNEGLTVLPFGPALMHHDIDRGCNLECVMCRDAKVLPTEKNVMQAIVDMKSAMALGGLEQIWFSGAGEVFAMRKLVKLLETDIFSSGGVSLAINTNLTYFNEKLWERIGHNKILHVVVSADGATPEVYDAIRIGGSWTELVENMRFLAGLRDAGKIGAIVWNYTVQKQNVADVGNAVRFARDLGFDAIRFIAQLGALSRTNGNMFEDYDIPALDALYDQLKAVDALEDPRVAIVELYMRDRAYRTAEHRLNLAQHIFERRGYSGDDSGPVPEGDWHKSARLVRSVMAEFRGNATYPKLSAANRDFLRRFAEAEREARPATSRIARLRAHFAIPQVEDRRATRWARAVSNAG